MSTTIFFLGVSLTHYNMVSNMTQLMHPGVTMMHESGDDHQETTVAVLPFFHIYAMNTIMTVGLQIGAKIVTVPRFEPEMYLKALVTYKVSYLCYKVRICKTSFFVTLLTLNPNLMNQSTEIVFRFTDKNWIFLNTYMKLEMKHEVYLNTA